MRFYLDGEMPPYLLAKDIILQVDFCPFIQVSCCPKLRRIQQTKGPRRCSQVS